MKVITEEVVIHGILVRGTVFEEPDPGAVEDAEEFLASHAAANTAKGIKKPA